VLIDLNIGRIVLSIDGVSLGCAFGWGSRLFKNSEQRAQSEIIQGGHLFPVFALRGPILQRGQVAERKFGKKGISRAAKMKQSAVSDYVFTTMQ